MAVAKELVDEVGFVMCRDERCDDDSVHPAHDLDKKRNKLQATLRCPLCTGELIKLRKTRWRCGSCQWRGSQAEALLGAKHA